MIPPINDSQIVEVSGFLRERLQEAGADGAMVEFMLRKYNLVHDIDRLIVKAMTEYREVTPIIERSPVATVEIGVFQTHDNLIQAFEKAGYFVDNYEASVLRNVSLAFTPQVVDFYSATIPELGFGKAGCSMHQAYVAIEQAGGIQLPAEAELAFRLKYKEQATPAGTLVYSDLCDGPASRFRFYFDWCNGGRSQRLVADSYRPDEESCGGPQRNTKGWMFGKP